MNSKQIGNITEIKVILAFIEQGFNVLSPYGDCERYDFVVEINSKFYKIQVKTSHLEDGRINFSTASTHYSNGKCIHDTYTKKEIDYFATTYENQVYLIPVEECGGRSKSLRFEPTKNGQARNVSWAKDYTLEAVIKTLS